MKRIKLTGGRGEVVGEVVHSNPNYMFVVQRDGREVTVPMEIVETVTTTGERQPDREGN